MFNSENAQKKWAPLLDHADCAPIQDSYRRAVTATLLENQEKALKETAAHSSFQINEVNDTATGDVNNFDPVLIALVRRAMPSLIAYDIAGVQPMSGPTGLVFSMVSEYGTNKYNDGADARTSVTAGSEALFDEAKSVFSGDSPGTGLPVTEGEALNAGVGTGDGSTTTTVANQMSAMGFSIRKAAVEAKTRALKAGYTMELAQDLKAIHGLDAEAELANILSTEILAEINREVISTINDKAIHAPQGASTGTFVGTNTADNLGARWAQEKFQALVYAIEKSANSIGVKTRRGKGNFVIVSPNVGSALAASGYLQYGEAIKNNGLNIDAQVNTFAGTLNGSLKVYIDPYNTDDVALIGYRGASPYDAGLFYCPYVPLTMVKAVGENDFQPRIAFKTRYGMIANPYAISYSSGVAASSAALGADNSNPYFQRLAVSGL